MTRVIKHVRSNVVAYLALFVALGGTSYAAVSIPNHSVTPSKLDSKLLGGYVRGWVKVSSSGRLIASGGRWNASMDSASPGRYSIAWRSLPSSNCTSFGSVDVAPGPATTPGFLVSTTFKHRGHEFTGVNTYAASGQQMPLPFDLILVCATPR